MKITLLGTGTPAPSLTRQSSGYLFAVGDDLIVMDHGPGAHHRLIESGHRAVEVSHAFLSHLHYDHCMDYARLVLQRWDMGAGRIPDLQVYGPTPIARMTELLFGEDGVYGPDIRARVEHQSSIDVFEARGGIPPQYIRTRRLPGSHRSSLPSWVYLGVCATELVWYDEHAILRRHGMYGPLAAAQKETQPWRLP